MRLDKDDLNFDEEALSENQQFLFNVSLIPPLCIDNQKMLNNYFSLFHLPVMEIQTPFLPKE